ncbi:EF-hand domain-containing protein [Kribbella sp. NPDC056861]|uniref:EF-hand domain-containing protein n=1 Tax=Kribbella sp. NPDC056861 TaxID=3154857 RepID=UPI00341BF61B
MTVSDTISLLDRKIDVCFSHGDQNGDGVLEGADALALAARIVAYLGEPFGSDKAHALFKAFETFWEHASVQFDQDKDGKITPLEWRDGLRKAFAESESGFERGFKPLAEALWAICDKNNDGTVGPQEFAGFHKAFGTTPENSRIAFDRLDSDGDGSLSVDELLQAWKDFYTSSDPDAAGNWLFGDIWES